MRAEVEFRNVTFVQFGFYGMPTAEPLQQIETRDLKRLRLPPGAWRFFFFDSWIGRCPDLGINKPVAGEREDISPTYFVGYEFGVDEVYDLPGLEYLAEFMEQRFPEGTRFVLTSFATWEPIDDEDYVVVEPQLSLEDLLKFQTALGAGPHEIAELPPSDAKTDLSGDEDLPQAA